jgi:hypothetical protein
VSCFDSFFSVVFQRFFFEVDGKNSDGKKSNSLLPPSQRTSTTVPAVVLTLGGLLLPDTPNSLAARGKKQEALKVLRRVRGVDDVAAEFDDICLAADAAAAASRDSASGCSNSGWSMILRRKYRPELTMAVMIPLFQQLTGELVCLRIRASKEEERESF